MTAETVHASGARVLIVEDSRALRERMTTHLSELGEVNEILAVSPGAAAMDAFVEFAPSVVILEILIGRSSGVELLRELRRRSSGLGIIVFTSADLLHVRHACIQMGADRFVSKTADFHHVEDAVRLLASRSPV